MDANSMLRLILFFLTVYLLWCLWKLATRPKNLPPGPWGLPLVGYLPFLGKKPHVALAKLSESYGSVLSFFLGQSFVVVLGSYRVIREALVEQGDNFAGRPNFPDFVLPFNCIGILKSEGECLDKVKRFCEETLRNYGLGSSNMEPRINEEIHHFLQAIKNYNGHAADFGELIRLSFSNVICSLILGRRYNYNDPEFVHLVRLLEEHVSRVTVSGVEEALPWIFSFNAVARILFNLKSPRESRAVLEDYFRQKVEQFAQVHKKGSVDNFINAWLTQANKTKSDFFSQDNLCGVARDLFIAGTDTTANTLRWALLYMVRYPEIQSKVQREIDSIVGKTKKVTMLHQNKMPYTEATLMEVHRMANIIPLSAPHSNFRETTLGGYLIPERTIIVLNTWAVHKDPGVFPNPDQFKPERFLNSRGEIKVVEQLMPFSAGKRSCPGESLAKMELFLYFTNLLQNFNFRKVHGTQLNFDYEFSSVAMPKRHKLHALPRLYNAKSA